MRFFAHLPLVILLAVQLPVEPIMVTGKIFRPAGDRRQRSFELLLKADGALMAKTKTGGAGDFQISLDKGAALRLEIFAIDPLHPADTIFLAALTEFKQNSIKLNLYPWTRHVDDDNHVVCPRCGRSDDVEDPAVRKSVTYFCTRDQVCF